MSPLDIPLFLSGNFGELRNNHFHAGTDFKTQGGIGQPVKAVQEGYVSRIGVSPYGYGNVLYLAHPDGTASVYGHLDKFVPRIEALVRDSQYRRESFAVNLLLSPHDLPVTKGERIGLSGNTGGSGGPHLHFELRDSTTEVTFDPLPYLKKYISDTRAPEISGIRLFPQPGKGIANGSTRPLTVSLNRNKAGQQSVGTITAWGVIGVGVKAYDYMNLTHNIYGVKDITLKVDGKEAYHAVMDRFSFANSRALNSYVDWAEWIDHKHFFMKSYVEPGNLLGVNRLSENGLLDINEERTYRLEYILKDAYGNTTHLNFTIVGKQTAIPAANTSGEFFAHNIANVYKRNGISLLIPHGNLYTDIYFEVDTSTGLSSCFSPVYTLRERVPLHDYSPLTLTITDDVYPDKSKYGVVQISPKGAKSWLGGSYNFGGTITTKIRELSSFAVMLDTVPPTIQLLEQKTKKGTRRDHIAFKITDDLSGIKSYRGTVDGHWVLFEYDAKRNYLYYKHDATRFGKQQEIAGQARNDSATKEIVRPQLKLVVTDDAGNESQFTCEYPIL
ncbi:peptidase M23 [Bacteroidia bacterium]|nr:peptidase M23 [Bacteroidia bacterium]